MIVDHVGARQLLGRMSDGEARRRQWTEHVMRHAEIPDGIQLGPPQHPARRIARRERSIVRRRKAGAEEAVTRHPPRCRLRRNALKKNWRTNRANNRQIFEFNVEIVEFCPKF